MGVTVTKFLYSSLEQALEYSSYYSDILLSYGNSFSYQIFFDGTEYLIEFKIYDTRGKDNTGSSEGTRYLPEHSPEDS
jgi:hypothetical protein